MSANQPLVLILAAGAVLCSCTSPSTKPTPAPSATTSALPIGPLVEQVEPWTYNQRSGRIVHTPHYRLYTTQTEPVLLARLPLFLESALAAYRAAAVGPGSSTLLPPPSLKLDTFILSNRADWARLTRQLMGEQADTFLKIQRGGYAWGGRAVLFDIGTQDTMAIAAHEGWHQYTQRTFAQPLPIWLEEGLATYMEGHRWGGNGGGTPIFLGWSNVERFDQLRKAEAQGKLLGLEELLNSSPQSLVNSAGGGSNDDALVYYAQVWALTHFLYEGGGGKYRERLSSLLNDAAAGRIDRTLGAVLGPEAARSALMRRNGPGVFIAYFDRNITPAAHEYDAFIRQIVQPGSRGPIVEGKTPIKP